MDMWLPISLPDIDVMMLVAVMTVMLTFFVGAKRCFRIHKQQFPTDTEQRVEWSHHCYGDDPGHSDVYGEYEGAVKDVMSSKFSVETSSFALSFVHVWVYGWGIFEYEILIFDHFLLFSIGAFIFMYPVNVNACM